MLKVNQYKKTLLEWFYLDDDNNTVRRAKDGYKGRYKKGDIVRPYQLGSNRYKGVHIPLARHTVPYHHLILLLRGVEIPDNAVIDHLNGNTRDNRPENIRITTQQINCKNKRIRSDNSTGITGINKSGNYYVIRRQINGKRVYFGCAKTLEEAKKILESNYDKITADGYTERHGK